MLATHLGYERPADVRDLIKRNMEELEAFGIIPHRTENTGQRGRPGTAFYLNRQQALLICILSKTEKANDAQVHT